MTMLTDQNCSWLHLVEVGRELRQLPPLTADELMTELLQTAAPGAAVPIRIQIRCLSVETNETILGWAHTRVDAAVIDGRLSPDALDELDAVRTVLAEVGMQKPLDKALARLQPAGVILLQKTGPAFRQ